MQIYHYSPFTGGYTHSTEARISPRDKRPLIPGHATDKTPPEAGPGQKSVFANGAWSLVHDFRGTEWWDADGQRHVIGKLGEALPDGGFLTPPPPEMVKPVWGENGWEETHVPDPDADIARAIKAEIPYADLVAAVLEDRKGRPDKLTALAARFDEIKGRAGKGKAAE